MTIEKPAALDDVDEVRTLAAPRRHPGGWASAYRRRLVLTDVVVIIGVVVVSEDLRFVDPRPGRLVALGGVGYWAVGALLAVGWVLALAVHGAWDLKSLGTGPAEFRRVTVATCAVFSLIAILSFLTGAEIARGYLAMAFPLGLSGLLAGRWVWRQLLSEHRRAGNFLSSVLVIGGWVSAPELAGRLRLHYEAGYRVAGLCLPGGALAGPDDHDRTVDGFPVLGGTDDVPRVIEESRIDTVAVAASETFGSEQIRRLAWELEGTNVHMILAPALTDVAGPRIHVEPVSGLPLMDVRAPQFRGPKAMVKVLLDYLIATLAVILLSPLLVLTAMAILASSGRPLFYRPLRVGRGGRVFRLIRFRTMTERGAPISRVGRAIRGLGIDRSVQLFNVLAGNLSMVGARPIDPDEVVREEAHLERRIRVRPGMTGPCQVLGRRDLSVDDQLQLDLHYIENWSVCGDLVIMVRAIQALVRRRRVESAAAAVEDH